MQQFRAVKNYFIIFHRCQWTLRCLEEKEEVRREAGDDSPETFRRKSFEMMCRCLSPETAGVHNLALVTTIYEAKFDLILLKVNGGSRITLGHFEKGNCSSHFHSGRRWLNEEISLELFSAKHKSCKQHLLFIRIRHEALKFLRKKNKNFKNSKSLESTRKIKTSRFEKSSWRCCWLQETINSPKHCIYQRPAFFTLPENKIQFDSI